MDDVKYVTSEARVKINGRTVFSLWI